MPYIRIANKFYLLFKEKQTKPTMKKIRIYVHVPFCESKCSYCDFASFVCGEDLKEKYFNKLEQEILNCPYKDRLVESVYIGGGTPSSVDVLYIEKIMNAIRTTFVVDKNAEITIECNPASENYEKLKKYRELGINRISFGVQSLNDKTLKFLNRRHTKQDAINAIKDAQKAGFQNISADLMIGVSESQEDLIASTKQLIDLGVKHLSAYMLQIEEGTPLYNAYQKDKNIVPNDDECVNMYDRLVDFLCHEKSQLYCHPEQKSPAVILSEVEESSGCGKLKHLLKKPFNHYEISNFALKGYECQHNLGYWVLDDYVGFGLSAHSYVDGIRFANSRNFEDYFIDKIASYEKITKEQQIEEKIMLGLRACEGVSIQELKDLGYDITQNSNFAKFVEQGIIKIKGDLVTLNPDFYGVSNSVIVKLLP